MPDVNVGEAIKQELGSVKDVLVQAASEAKGLKDDLKEAKAELGKFSQAAGKEIRIKIKADADTKEIDKFQKKMDALDNRAEIELKFEIPSNAKAKLAKEWNAIVNANQDKSMGEVVTAGSNEAKDVARLAIAYQALGGDLESITSQLPRFVEMMQEAQDVLKGSDNVQNYARGFQILEDALRDGIIEIDHFYDEISAPQKIEIFGDIGKQVQIGRDEVIDGIEQGIHDIQDKTEELGQAIDALTKKKLEYQKQMAEIENEARKARKHIRSDREYDDSVDWSEYSELNIYDLDSYNDKIQKIQISLQQVIRYKQQAEQEISDIRNIISNASSISDLEDMDLTDGFQNNIESIQRYESQIEYLNDRLVEEQRKLSESFDIGSEWNSDTIKAIIEAVRLLEKEITNLTSKFNDFNKNDFSLLTKQIDIIADSIKSITDNSVLKQSAQDFADVDQASTQAFDTTELTEYLKKLEEIKNSFKNLYSLLSGDNGLSQLITTLDTIGKSLSDNFDISEEKDSFAKNIKSIVDILNTQFGDAEKNIFQSLKQAIESIDSAFSTENLQKFSEKLNDIKSSIEGISINSSLSFNSGGDSQAIIQEWARQFQLFKKTYDEIFDLFKKNDTVHNDYLLPTNPLNSLDYYYQKYYATSSKNKSVPELFGQDAIRDKLNGTAEGYRGAIQLMMEFNKLLKEQIDNERELAQINLHDASEKIVTEQDNLNYQRMLSRYEQQEAFWQNVEQKLSNRVQNITTVGKQVERVSEKANDASQEESSSPFKDLFSYDDSGLIQKIEAVQGALTELQELFKLGFGISGDDENNTLTFFEQMTETLKELSRTFQSINSSLTILSDSFDTLATTLSETSEATSTLQQLSQQSGIKGFIGFDANDIERITAAFTELKGTLVTIRDLIQHSLNIDETTMNQILRNAQENTEPLVKSSKMVEKKKAKAERNTKEKAQRKVEVGKEQAKDTVNQQLGNPADMARQIFSQGQEIGKQQIEGERQGLLDEAQELFNTQREVQQGVIDAAKDTLGVQSPSRVFKAIAKFCIEGAIFGFQEGQDSLVNTVANVFDLKDKVSGLNKEQISKLIADMTTRISNEFENSDTNEIQTSIQSYFNSILNGDSISNSLEAMGTSLKDSLPQEVINQILNGLTEQSLNNPEVDAVIDQKISSYKKGIDLISQYINDLKAKQDEFGNLSGGEKNRESSRIGETIQSMQNLSSEIVSQVGYEDVYEELVQKIQQLKSIQKNINKYGTISLPSDANLAKGIEDDYKALEATIQRVREEIKQLISAENNKIQFSENIDQTVEDITNKLVDKIVTNIKFDKVEEAAQTVQDTLDKRQPLVFSVKFDDTTNSLNGLTSKVSELQQALINPLQGAEGGLEQTQSQLNQTETKVERLTDKFTKLVETFRQTGDKQAFIDALNTRQFTMGNMQDFADSQNITFSKKTLKKPEMAAELVEGISKQMTGLNTVENRINKLLEDIDTLNEKIGNLWGNYNSQEAINNLQSDIEQIEQLLQSIEQRISNAEQQSVDDVVSKSTAQFTNLSNSITAINSAVSQISRDIQIQITPNFDAQKLTDSKNAIDEFVQSIGANEQNINIKDIISQYETLIDSLKNYKPDSNSWSQFTIFSPDDSSGYAETYITQIYKLIRSIKPEDFSLLGINPDGDEGYLGYLKNIRQMYTDLIKMNENFTKQTVAYDQETDPAKQSAMFSNLENLDKEMFEKFQSLLDEINNLMGKASENSKNMVDSSVQVAINEYEKLRSKIEEVQSVLKAIYGEMNTTHQTTTQEIITEFQTLYSLISDFPQIITEYNSSIRQIQPLDDNIINKFRDFNGAFNKALAALSSFNLYMTNFANGQSGITSQVAQIISAINGFGTANFDSQTVNQAIGELGNTAQIAHTNIMNLRNLLSGSSTSGNYTVFDSELNVLDEMIIKIRDEIPQAVEVKNNAFQTELEMVKSVVYQEIQAFNDLAGQMSLIATSISDVFQDRTIDIVPNTYGIDLNSLGESLNSDIAETMNARNQAFLAEGKVVERMVKSESGHIQELGKTIKDFMKSIDFKNIGIEKLDGISKMFENFNNMVTSSTVKDFVEAIKEVSEELSKVSQDIGDNNIFSVIKDILGRSKELEHLVTILKSTRQELEAIKQQQQQSQQQQQQSTPTPPTQQQPPQSTYSPQQTAEPIVRTRIVGQNGANWTWDDFFSDFEGAADSVKESVEKRLGEIVKIVESYKDEYDEETQTYERKLMSSSVYGTQASVVLKQRYQTPKDENGNAIIGDDGKPVQIPYVGMSPFTSTTLDESRSLQLDALISSLARYEHELENAGLLTEEFKTRIEEQFEDIVKLTENNNASLDSVMVKDKDLRQDVKEATKESDQIYKNSIAIINQYIKARNDYNSLLAQSMKNQNHVTQADLDQAKSLADTLRNQAETAMLTLDDAGKRGLSSEDHVKDAWDLFNANEQGSMKSRRNIRNAEYDQMLSVAKQLVNVQDEINKLRAEDIKHGNESLTTDNRREDALRRQVELQQQYDDAYLRLLDMQEQGLVSDSQIQAFLSPLQSGQITSGTPKTQDTVAGAMASEYQKAEKAVENYEKQLERVERYQRMAINGENVSGRLQGAINNLNEARKVAQDYLGLLNEINKTNQQQGFSAQYSQNQLDAIANPLNDTRYNGAVSGSGVGKNAGFENAINGYETLIAAAQRYYKIQQKLASGSVVSPSDMEFLRSNDLDAYFKAAEQSVMSFIGKVTELQTSEQQAQWAEAVTADPESVGNKLMEVYEKFQQSRSDAMRNIISSMTNDLQNNLNQMDDKIADKPESFVDKLEDLRDRLINGTANQDGLLTRIGDMTDNDWANMRLEQYEEIIKEIKQYNSEIAKLDKASQPVNQLQKATLDRKMAEWKSIHSGATEANADITKLQEVLRNVDSQSGLNDVNVEFQRIVTNANNAGKTGISFANQLQQSFTNLGRYLMSFASFYRIINTIKQGVTVVKELDTAMTNLRKVIDDSDTAFKKFEQDAFTIAGTVGSTAKDIVDAATEWGRLGYNLKESAELAKASAIYANVGDIDVTTATTDLVSALKAFGKDADEAMGVVDILNEIGNNYAVSSEQLGEILKKSSSSLAVSGDTLENLVAMGAAMNAITQDASVTGSTLKIVGLRLRGATTELQEAGEETEGMISSTSKLRKEIMQLTENTSLGAFDIMKNPTEFKTTYDIIDGIAQRWEDLANVDQANLLELMAGIVFARKIKKFILKNTFNCVDYLKLYTTIIGKPDYDGLKSQR